MSYIQFNRLGTDGLIGEIVLDRPQVKNAFNTEMAKQLLDTFKEVASSDVRVVLLTSSNASSFCSGADLKERNNMTEQQWKDQHKLFEDTFYAIADLPQPTIAVVDGYAVAGGFEMVLNCDMIVAARSAIFGLAEVKRGIMPGCGASRLLPKRIGPSRAKEWLCTGRFVNAEEADDVGLLNRLTDSDKLRDTALELAESIVGNAPIAVQSCKQAVDHMFGMDDKEARVVELVYYNRCIDTEDRLEGVRAFNEKRPPRFTGN